MLKNSGMKVLCEISSNQAKAKAGYFMGFILMSKSARLNNPYK